MKVILNSIALAALAATSQRPCGQEWSHGTAGILIYDQKSAIFSIDSLQTLEKGTRLTCKMAIIGGKVITATMGIAAPMSNGDNANLVYAKDLANASLLSADTNAMATGWSAKMGALLKEAPSWLTVKMPFAEVLFVARGVDGTIRGSVGTAAINLDNGKVSTSVTDLAVSPRSWTRQVFAIAVPVKRELELGESERAKKAGIPKYTDFRFTGIENIIDYQTRFLSIASQWYPDMIGPPYESALLDDNGARWLSAKQECR